MATEQNREAALSKLLTELFDGDTERDCFGGMLDLAIWAFPDHSCRKIMQ